MSSLDKLIKKLENNPKNVSFDDIKKLLINNGWELNHTKGSHHQFSDCKTLITLPYIISL